MKLSRLADRAARQVKGIKKLSDRIADTIKTATPDTLRYIATALKNKASKDASKRKERETLEAHARADDQFALLYTAVSSSANVDRIVEILSSVEQQLGVVVEDHRYVDALNRAGVA